MTSQTWVNLGSFNRLSPIWHQTVGYLSQYLLTFIWTIWNTLQWNMNENTMLLLKKMLMKLLSAKWRPFYLSQNVIRTSVFQSVLDSVTLRLSTMFWGHPCLERTLLPDPTCWRYSTCTTVLELWWSTQSGLMECRDMRNMSGTECCLEVKCNWVMAWRSRLNRLGHTVQIEQKWHPRGTHIFYVAHVSSYKMKDVTML